MKSKNTITIYSKWLKDELEQAGHKPTRSRPNNRKPGQRIYYFERTSETERLVDNYRVRYAVYMDNKVTD